MMMPLHIRMKWRFWSMIVIAYLSFLPTVLLDISPYNTTLDKVCGVIVVTAVTFILFMDVFYRRISQWYSNNYLLTISLQKRRKNDFWTSAVFASRTHDYYSVRLDQYPTGQYVYVIKDISASGYYKIGKTNNPARRLRKFEVLLPISIHIITIIPCDDMTKLESSLHGQFWRKRVNGEWFNLSGDDLESILPVEIKIL